MAEGEKEGQRGWESVGSPPALQSPKDVVNRIFSQLDCIDLLHCSLVCKQWYRDSAELREGWKNEYLEAYIARGLSIKRETHPPSASCSIKGLHSWCF
ncbi:hypothetical protein EJ110_NYTH28205 [Nymphaea thermarum]|nr:hypothetical protein EJ110_NYTH28205 [Nymphaea thermarum]